MTFCMGAVKRRPYKGDHGVKAQRRCGKGCPAIPEKFLLTINRARRIFLLTV
jgi:hypothetical protein